MSAHGETTIAVMGEDDIATREFVSALRTNFPMLPDEEIVRVVDELRELNDLYGIALGA